MSPLIVLFGSFIIMLFIRVPISFSLIFSSVLTMIYGGISLMIVIQRIMSGLDSFALVAVPLFLLAGSIMEGEIIDRLLRLSETLIGRIPGALAHVNIVACKWQVEMHLARKTILHLLERKKWFNPPLLFEF